MIQVFGILNCKLEWLLPSPETGTALSHTNTLSLYFHTFVCFFTSENTYYCADHSYRSNNFRCKLTKYGEVASNFNVNAVMVSVCAYTLTHKILRSCLWQDIYD